MCIQRNFEFNSQKNRKMASVPYDTNKLNFYDNYNNLQNDGKDIKVQSCLGVENNSMIYVMGDLIKTMQQLQKMMEIPTKQCENKNTPSSQTELLLHQVQSAMESTFAQLSANNRMLKPDDEQSVVSTTVPEEKVVLSTSEKWRLYTDMVQKKHESTKEYCSAKMRLGQELGLTFKETKREMLIGLWSNRLCTVLFLKEHVTEEDILEDVEQWERIEQARFELFKKHRNRNN